MFLLSPLNDVGWRFFGRDDAVPLVLDSRAGTRNGRQIFQRLSGLAEVTSKRAPVLIWSAVPGAAATETLHWSADGSDGAGLWHVRHTDRVMEQDSSPPYAARADLMAGLALAQGTPRPTKRAT